jgi:hypothetical protein
MPIFACQPSKGDKTMTGLRWYKLLLLGLVSVGALPYPSFHPAQAAFAADERKPATDPVKPVSISALWHDPGVISSLDLAFGEGGPAHAPPGDAIYSFEKEDLGGSSPKFYVKDQDGVQWLVKVGDEARGETAATRFVWAMGYFVDEDYFVPEIHVSGIAKLHRQSHSIHKDGTITNARLKRTPPKQKKLNTWAWADNPFHGSRELNGLRVMMALINNWDLKTVNNKVYGPKEGKDAAHKDDSDDKEGNSTDVADRGNNSSPQIPNVRYVVSDLGASCGRTGGFSSRSKGKLKDYQRDNFIRATTPETVDFVMRTKPGGILRVFKPHYYRQRTAMAETVENVPRADAKWIGGQLAQLTPEQIRSAFLAAGFTPREADGYRVELQKRIVELNAL